MKEADITIDLNGFRLHGMGVARYGIHDTSPSGGYPSVIIRNGTIAGFSRWGIVGHGHSWIVEHMRVTVNGVNGVNGVGLGDAARIVNSTITANGYSGVVCLSFCHVESNVIANNGLYGVAIGSGSVIGNTIAENKWGGISEISEGLPRYNEGWASSIGHAHNSIYRNHGQEIHAQTPLQGKPGHDLLYSGAE